MALGRPTSPTRRAGTIAGSLTVSSTALGATNSYNLGTAHRYFTVQAKVVRADGTSPANVTARLQGSLNGTDFHNLSAATTVTTGETTWNSTTAHAMTYIRLNSTAKAAGAGTWTLNGWIGVAGE